MPIKFINAWGYQGDPMNLPVADVEAALPFYTGMMGFEVVDQNGSPVKSITLARPDVRFAIVENGGDPTQDGCAFEVSDAAALLAEFRSRGFEKDASDIDTEKNHGAEWKVFYVVAPDGLCYWMGERVAPAS